MKIDCHVHVVSTDPASGCRMSSRMRRGPSYQYVLRRFGLHKTRDLKAREEGYVARLVSDVRSSELDRAVVLAFDGLYGPAGQDMSELSDLYVPNGFVRDLCRRFPGELLYGASVHPYRGDALEELARVKEDGAVLVKLLPNAHGFDPADERLKGYYRRAAELGLPLLFHAGFEHTVRVIDQAFGRPERLRLPLEQGATVIVAHCGGAGLLHLRETFPGFLELLAAYPNCFGDTSALANFWRTKYLWRLLASPRLRDAAASLSVDPAARVLHGSDYPIPVTPFSFSKVMSAGERRRLKKSCNPLQLDIELKRAAGMPDDVLTRAAAELDMGGAGMGR